MLAQIIPGGLAGLAIAIIVIVALFAIVLAACRGMGVPIPGWLVQIAVIVVVAIVAIAAIRLLLVGI